MKKTNGEKEKKLKRINITMLPDTYEWLRMVAFAKHSNISKEIREMIKYTRAISYVAGNEYHNLNFSEIKETESSVGRTVGRKFINGDFFLKTKDGKWFSENSLRELKLSKQ